MDPLSHAVLGAAFAMSFEKEDKQYLDQTLRPAYGVVLISAALSAMAPDLDSLIKSNIDQLLYVQFHRHFTHSLLMIPVISLIVSALLYFLGLRKYADFLSIWKWGTLGVLTHGFLDACTSYGTHLLWPFTDRRESWSIISIVDPVFTMPLIFGLGMSVWKKRKIFAKFALLFSLGYLVFGTFQHFRAKSFYHDYLRQTVEDEVHWVQVKPTIGNLWVWRAISLVGEQYRVDGVRLGMINRHEIYLGSTVTPYLPERDSPFAIDSQAHKDLLRFEFFSENLLYEVPEPFSQGDQWIGDLRYSLLPHSLEPLWVVVYPKEGHSDGHLPFQFTREVSKEKRDLYLRMLKGEAIQQAELDAF